MAPLNHAVILDARRARMHSRRLCVEGITLRATANELRKEHREARQLVGGAMARRRAATSNLGTWPYWAPPTQGLWDVLVMVGDAA